MHIREHTLFSTLHPAALLCYIVGALVLSMVSAHPLMVLVSFLAAVGCNGFFYGWRSTGKMLACLIPVAALIAGMNFFTNHRGLTILFQIGHTPYTLESLCYGANSALMLGAVLAWFRCYTAIISNGKFLYLFGRKFPGTSLLLSMILKLFPETRYKIRCIQNAQQDMGNRGKLRKAMRQISCLLEWSMEDAIETADSMRARGYGERERTSYETYTFAVSDGAALALFLAAAGILAVQTLSGKLSFAFYPTFSGSGVPGGREWGCAALYLVWLLAPLWMELWDRMNQYVRLRRNNNADSNS